MIKDLLARLTNTPPEEQEAAIAEALTGAKASPADLSEEIGSLFTELYGEGENVTPQTADQIELLAKVADGVEGVVQEAATRAARASEIGQRINDLQQNSSGDTEPTAETIADTEPADDETTSESAAPAMATDNTPAVPPAAQPNSSPAPAAPAAQTPVAPASAAPASAAPALATEAPLVPLGTQQASALPALQEQPAGKFASFSLVAAADIPGFSTGQVMQGGLGDFARAYESRMFPMISGGVNSGKDGERTRVGIARIRRELPEQFRITNERDAEDVVRHACDESRLPGGSLVASAGWCAPSETLYDLCPIRMTEEGIISLPQVQTRRGGIKFPADFDWSAVWSSIGFHLTEEEVMAGTEKNCIEVPCPSEWPEYRMEVAGVCLRTPILMERGWPERVEQFMAGALLIHAHKMNALRLWKMEQLSTKIPMPGPRPGAEEGAWMVDPHGPGAVESLLSMLELQVQYVRYRDRLPQDATLEMIAPYWLRGILKSDLRKKIGIDNRWSISNEMIDGYLRNVGVNPQYVYDWQDAFEHPMNQGGFGGPIPLKWPDRVKLMLYPAGTFFELSDEVINLDGVYDHASLIQNVYTGLFTEEGWQVGRRCMDSYVIEMDLCPNGLSGSHVPVACNPTQPPAPPAAAALCAS
ncbi:major capsid protein [Streptomyces albidoflavus]|uniref:major capsid protein n=1 Tax=Streptomyces albidoflavus TaxID=1886 RepID=UPI001022A032|nr:major capsid protein [Streptomyces albidoflavus]